MGNSQGRSDRARRRKKHADSFKRACTFSASRRSSDEGAVESIAPSASAPRLGDGSTMARLEGLPSGALFDAAAVQRHISHKSLRELQGTGHSSEFWESGGGGGGKGGAVGSLGPGRVPTSTDCQEGLLRKLSGGGTKGLRNLGQNNCFLNACLQCLWHLDSFRAHVLALPEGAGGELLSTIRELFLEFATSDDRVLDPSAVRKHLSDRFALGEVADAAEAFEEVILELHENHLSALRALAVDAPAPRAALLSPQAPCAVAAAVAVAVVPPPTALDAVGSGRSALGSHRGDGDGLLERRGFYRKSIKLQRSLGGEFDAVSDLESAMQAAADTMVAATAGAGDAAARRNAFFDSDKVRVESGNTSDGAAGHKKGAGMEGALMPPRTLRAVTTPRGLAPSSGKHGKRGSNISIASASSASSSAAAAIVKALPPRPRRMPPPRVRSWTGTEGDKIAAAVAVATAAVADAKGRALSESSVTSSASASTASTASSTTAPGRKAPGAKTIKTRRPRRRAPKSDGGGSWGRWGWRKQRNGGAAAGAAAGEATAAVAAAVGTAATSAAPPRRKAPSKHGGSGHPSPKKKQKTLSGVLGDEYEDEPPSPTAAVVAVATAAAAAAAAAGTASPTSLPASCKFPRRTTSMAGALPADILSAPSITERRSQVSSGGREGCCNSNRVILGEQTNRAARGNKQQSYSGPTLSTDVCVPSAARRATRSLALTLSTGPTS